jgi:Polycystin cation channel
MTPEERLSLNPIQKWQKYKKFPVKLICHILIALLFSWMVYIYGGNDSSHTRNTLMFFHQEFLNQYEHEKLITDPKELQESILGSVASFFGLSQESVAGGLSPIKAHAVIKEHRDHQETDVEIGINDYKEKLREYTDRLQSIDSVHLHFVVRDEFQGQFWNQCYTWLVVILYDLNHANIATVKLRYVLEECETTSGLPLSAPMVFDDGKTRKFSSSLQTETRFGPSFWILLGPFTAFLLLLTTTILQLRAAIKLQMLRRMGGFSSSSSTAIRRQFDSDSTGLEVLYFVISHIIQIFATISCFLDIIDNVNFKNSLLGIGAFLAFVNLLKYLRFFPSYYVLVQTLSESVPKVARFMAGVAPVLLGYALFGTAVFWESRFFASIPQSILTLFSLLNGDVIHDVFEDVCAFSPIAGPAYLFSFMFLFMYVVLNIFLSIVESTFSNETAKKSHSAIRPGLAADPVLSEWVESLKKQIDLFGRLEDLIELKEYINEKLAGSR